MITIPNGATIAIAASYGAEKAISAVTNASPALASLAVGHAVAEGDYIEVTSGWEHLCDKVVRAGTPSTNDIPLLGIDSTSTALYPAGGGTGSIREILTWTQLTQILTASTSGGDQQFLEYQTLESDHKKRVPTFKNPISLAFTVADDPTLAGYLLACAANDDKLKRAVKITYLNGSVIVYNAYISADKTPTMTVNEVMACGITLSLLAEPVRYA
jgi:hypothetical protein